MKNRRQNEIMHNSLNGTTDESECVADDVILSHIPQASFPPLDAKFQEPQRGKPVWAGTISCGLKGISRQVGHKTGVYQGVCVIMLLDCTKTFDLDWGIDRQIYACSLVRKTLSFPVSRFRGLQGERANIILYCNLS